jgi:hypothetical protein
VHNSVGMNQLKPLEELSRDPTKLVLVLKFLVALHDLMIEELGLVAVLLIHYDFVFILGVLEQLHDVV